MSAPHNLRDFERLLLDLRVATRECKHGGHVYVRLSPNERDLLRDGGEALLAAVRDVRKSHGVAHMWEAMRAHNLTDTEPRP